MAKQTFTTGQVLTAAQMQSLQETALGGGPATAKTANYVLVAADAGTTVAMNAAGATTITVNTGLFAAGDTVFIQNIGAGACTITAGTATVDTAGSLILPQYDAGILYFTSASAAIFYDYIQVGATSPLTTKGDLYTFGTSDTRLGVGANGTTLVADSGETTGLKWATPAGAATSLTLLNAGGTALTGAATITVNVSSYNNYWIFVEGGSLAAGPNYMVMRFNGDTSSTTYQVGGFERVTASNVNTFTGSSPYILFGRLSTAASVVDGYLTISAGNSTGPKPINYFANCDDRSQIGSGAYTGAAAITSISMFSPSSSNFDAGTIYVYGGN